VDGKLIQLAVKPGDTVEEGKDLAFLHDQELGNRLRDMDVDIKDAERQIGSLESGQAGPPGRNAENKLKIVTLTTKRDIQAGGREELMHRTNSVPGRPGYFKLTAPNFPPGTELPQERRIWTILNSDFRENLTDKRVKASDQLLRLGNTVGPWEVELKIPQKHAGQVLSAFEYEQTDELDIDLLVRSDPTHSYKGKLKRLAIGGEAIPQKDDNNESEPVVSARVRIEGPGIAEADQIPRSLLLTGAEVRAKIRCGNHRMGYSLFYGVWEFMYEKVVFFF
jgi:hypothetical protein